MRKRYDYNSPDLLGASGDAKEGRRNSIHSLHILYAVGLLLYLGGLYCLIDYLDSLLPNPLQVSDEISNPDAFIAERAHHDLEFLTGLGPRIAGGYENEVLAVDFLKREVEAIRLRANKNQNIEMDLQVVSGSYNLTFDEVTTINTYTKVMNVVVKLHGIGAKNSLLVNSHYDSVPTSPGASDDGINVVAMLEVLRKLSKRSERLNHDVIFLFNGAEETPMHASHGFITQHKWASDCKVVVNLEAAGLGNKIVLFQTGPKRPWLMKYYSQVPHPYGQVAGEEIFQSNLIPSDTDFRIFRDFGGVVGLDMAFYKNGYVYHTKYDELKAIPLGSIQHVGDNVLSLVKNIANSSELDDVTQTIDGNVVYFDLLGLFVISYTELTGVILNFLSVGLSFVIFAKSLIDFGLGWNRQTLKQLTIALITMTSGWILSLIFVVAVAISLDFLQLSMSWYTNTWLMCGLYSIPTIAISSLSITCWESKKLSISTQAQLQAHVTRLIWTILLFVCTVFNIRSSYALFIPVMFNSISFVIIHLCKLQHSVKKWHIIYITSLIIPTIMLMYQLCAILALFIPITGRIGSDKPVDLIAGVISSIFTVLILSPYIALITLVRNRRAFILGLFGLFLVTVVLVCTPLGFPYNAEPSHPTPQRYWILHTNRIIHRGNQITHRESGYFLLNMDRNSPRMVLPYVKDLQRARPVTDDCAKYSMCALPLAHSKMMQIMQYSTWVPAGPPVITEPATLKVHSKEFVATNVVRLNVTVTGPDRWAVYLIPQENMSLIETSLIRPTPDYMKEGREKVYYLLNASGQEKEPMHFTFDIKVPDKHTGPVVDLALNAIYVHNRSFMKTPHYQEFINSFPDWADVTAWLGTYESFLL